MGYTHYWSFNKAPNGEAKKTEETYQLAIRQCQRIVKAYNSAIKSIDTKHPDRLSGFSAHTKIKEYGGLNFNGTGELSHETFSMREHFNQNEDGFCKTAHNPYDKVVTAYLIVLKHYLGNLIEVSSDGKDLDFLEGFILAKDVTGIKELNHNILNKS